jgi:hypothetical protein
MCKHVNKCGENKIILFICILIYQKYQILASNVISTKECFIYRTVLTTKDDALTFARATMLVCVKTLQKNTLLNYHKFLT